MTRKENLILMNSIRDLPPTDEPIKKTGATTVGKVESDGGIAVFVNTKNVTATFKKPFIKVPLIQLTMGDAGQAPVFKSLVTKTQLTMKFQSNRTGSVDRVATERP